MIKLIRASKTPAEAREGLMANFGMTEIQARAVLDLQLQRLTGLEREKILDELKQLREEMRKELRKGAKPTSNPDDVL